MPIDKRLHEENRRSWNAATDAHNSHKHDQAAFLRDVVSALIGAGLTLKTLREYPFSNGAKLFNGMRELPGRRMVPPEQMPSMPLMYGIVAERSR